MKTSIADYNDSVFINCPYDKYQYTPLLHAIIFCVYRCGFIPKMPLGEDNALDNRLLKIERVIEECRYGIHDLSRTELNENGLPRFNMPFELGIFFGAKRFGNKEQKSKNALIFDKEKYRYQSFISDLGGVDIKAHNNDPFEAIINVRDWLTLASRRQNTPGPDHLKKQYRTFKTGLPRRARKLGMDENNIPFNDYCVIVEEALRKVMK